MKVRVTIEEIISQGLMVCYRQSGCKKSYKERF